MSSKPAPAVDSQCLAEPFLYVEASAVCAPVEHAAADAALQREQIKDAARREGFAQAQAVAADRIAGERELLANLIREFAGARQHYFERVELEVVQLALSIARRILHREAQIDPLLLAGMVRVALERLERGTKVVLRLNPEHASEWRGYFARLLDPGDVPEIVDDSGLAANRCVLETEMGRTDLGLEVQLKEVERGLLDLLAERPQAAP